MKPILKNALALALPLALAACGGGGGKNSIPTDQEKPAPILADVAIPKDMEMRGVILAAPRHDISQAEALPIVDGSNQVLSPPGYGSYRIPLTQDGATQIGNMITYTNVTAADGHSYRNFAVSGNAYQHIQFGFFDTTGELVGGFSRGNITQNLPPVGQANYRGDAVVAFTSDVRSFDRMEIGTSEAEVDFGRRYIFVNINSAGYQCGARGHIVTEGGVFVPYSQVKAVSGFFAGDGAQEITGTLTDVDAGVVAAFGAKQQ